MVGRGRAREPHRGTAYGLLLLATLGLAVVWAAWRFTTEDELRPGVHVFQYSLLLVLAAAVALAFSIWSGYALLGLAVIGTVLPWLAPAGPRVMAGLIAAAALVSGVLWVARRSRAAAVTCGLSVVVSLLGLLLIL